MSGFSTSLVWTQSAAKGHTKLVLLALAEYADRNQVCQLSVRDIAALAGIKRHEVVTQLEALIDLGEIALVGKGGGRGKPSSYQITLESPMTYRALDVEDDPIPPIVPATQADLVSNEPSDHSTLQQPTPKWSHVSKWPTETDERSLDIATADVVAVLKAAGITGPEDQPLYWSRKEHREELRSVLEGTGLTVALLCERLSAARLSGQGPSPNMRRLSQLVDFAR